MSIESAKMFVERMNTDEDFAKNVTACKSAAARMTFVTAAGFDFTGEELAAVVGKLADGDLEAVTGGWNPPFTGDGVNFPSFPGTSLMFYCRTTGSLNFL